MSFEKLPNPDNVPGAVTTGYQLQNNNIYVLQTGLDTTEPYDNSSGTITIPAGGVVEVNGVMFKITANITLLKGNANTAYWVAIRDNNDGTATAELVTRPGAWNAEKQGFYRSDNRRVLNWVSLGSLSSPPSTSAVFTQNNSKGTWEFNPQQRGWYYASLRSGLGGGTGGNGGSGSLGSSGSAGGGGVASSSLSTTVLFFIDRNQLISDRKITIKVGGNGQSGSTGNAGVSGGGGGGGGGGSGSGEATTINYIHHIFTTGEVARGDGGSGGNGYTTNYTTGGEGGAPGQAGASVYYDGDTYGRGGAAGQSLGGQGGGGGGGGINSYNGRNGGAGGDGGLNGSAMANGSAGGYCHIYLITN